MLPYNLTVAEALTQIIDHVITMTGQPPEAVYVTLEEWAQLAEEVGTPEDPIMEIQDVPVLIKEVY